ncbi:hypothetical protein [Altericroceibacterium xinjiangense]|uniref:hypothetical protein n=1 Tax=Altericroceibacterium xinjiangense TaxID=762261 RepID=UPI000F7EF313|nr:hypothetical protein [Altericroceibacterium xinjiangense]
MPERQSRHPDNELIDELTEGGMVSQQGRAGGQISRDVGTRAEQKRAEGTLTGQEVERATGGDNPAEDARKGAKTAAHLNDKGAGSSPSQ